MGAQGRCTPVLKDGILPVHKEERKSLTLKEMLTFLGQVMLDAILDDKPHFKTPWM